MLHTAVKRPKENLPEEVAIYGFIADQIAPYAQRGAKVTIGSRTYSVATISTPAGRRRKIIVKGPDLRPRRQVISWLMMHDALHYGHTQGYRGHVANPLEFLIFAIHLPEIAKGLAIRKKELLSPVSCIGKVPRAWWLGPKGGNCCARGRTGLKWSNIWHF